MRDCAFCNFLAASRILENPSFFCVLDKYPVNPGHLLLISKRHVRDLFELSEKEFNDLYSILQESREKLRAEYKPDGFNVGANCGEAAGQTVFHFHLHVIPRFEKDVADPRGGIRNIKAPCVAYL
jgi:diadenosine tetraphosphate (Ap4A) HIT family hydrolase